MSILRKLRAAGRNSAFPGFRERFTSRKRVYLQWATGQPVDHRSDLFSLGSSIYFMCTGRPPFRAEHALTILNRICNDQHRPVDDVNSDIPAELADVVDRLLSKNPADRFRDAHEVERQLESILLQLQNGQRSSRLRWRRTWLRWRDVIRKSAIGVGAVSVCVMAGVAFTYWGMTSGQTPIVETVPSTADKKPLNTILSPIITLPPDTFEQDLAETKRLLEATESNWSIQIDDSAGSNFESDKWSSELGEIKGLLK